MGTAEAAGSAMATTLAGGAAGDGLTFGVGAEACVSEACDAELEELPLELSD